MDEMDKILDEDKNDEIDTLNDEYEIEEFIEDINFEEENKKQQENSTIKRSRGRPRKIKVEDEEENRKEKEVSKNKYLTARFSGRFTNSEDIAMLNRWKRDLESENKSFYNELNKVIRNYLMAREKNGIMREWKMDLFHALRKTSWAALSPYQLNMNRRFRTVDIELAIMNMKLNVIMNALFKGNEILESQINNPSAEYLKEWNFFEKHIRASAQKLDTEWLQKSSKNLTQGKKAYESFLASLSENQFEEFLEEFNSLVSTPEEQLKKL